MLTDDRGNGVRTLVLGPELADLLEFCDGTSNMDEIAARIDTAAGDRSDTRAWVLAALESLFATGLIALRRSA